MFFQTNFNIQRPEHQENRRLWFAEHHMMFLPSLMLKSLPGWAPGHGCRGLCPFLAWSGRDERMRAAFSAAGATRVTQKSTCKRPAKPLPNTSLGKGDNSRSPKPLALQTDCMGADCPPPRVFIARHQGGFSTICGED